MNAISLADDCGGAGGGPEGAIAPGHYAEGVDAPEAQPGATHPAIVRVFAARGPDTVPELLETTGKAVVRAFGLADGNVVVRFEPADPERMYWG
jgi:hypothetical protein